MTGFLSSRLCVTSGLAVARLARNFYAAREETHFTLIARRIDAKRHSSVAHTIDRGLDHPALVRVWRRFRRDRTDPFSEGPGNGLAGQIYVARLSEYISHPRWNLLKAMLA